MNRTLLKIAWREARASAGKFSFVVLAVAAGVGALTGVRGFSEAFRSMLLTEARQLMAADASVRLFAQPSAEQSQAVDRLRGRGVEWTQVTETPSMVSGNDSPDPVLAAVKAVDPRVFPYYGVLTLKPGGTVTSGALQENLTAETALISEDLQLRLGLQPGQTMRVGGQPFRVAAMVTAEPDRMSGSFNVGPRVMLSREGLDRTELIGLGSRASQRLLFRLGPGSPAVTTVTAELKRVFPEALVVDYRETNPNIARGIDRATTFLSLVSLIALIVGAIGVGTAMHAHLQTKFDSIAVMKSIGARSGQIVRIYLVQTVLLGLAGGLVGIAIGALVQQIFPLFVERYFQLKPATGFSWISAGQGLALGLLTSLLFTLPPLLSIRTIRPALVLRREMEEIRLPWHRRLRSQLLPIGVGLAIALSLVGIASSLVGGSFYDRLRVAGYFVGGLLLSLLVLSGVAAALLRLLRLAVRSIPMPVTTRHALANLYRPGSQSQAILTAIGVGVMFTLTVYLVQHSVLREISRSAPPGMANVFFLDINAQKKDAFINLVRKQPGVEKPPELLATVSSRIVSVDGVAVERLPLSSGFARRFRMARSINTVDSQPEGTQVLRGAWWPDRPTEPQVSVAEGAARVLQLKPGSAIVWDSFGRRVQTRVAAIHRTDANRLRASVEFMVNTGVLDGLPTIYYGAARVKSEGIPNLQRVLYRGYPAVTVINVVDILDQVEEVVDQISLVIRFISGFAILAGAIILASAVAGSRFRRVREMIVFKTLGATRHTIGAMLSTEFLVLGSVAGVMGSLLATCFSAWVLRRMFDAPFQIDVVANLICILSTALIAAGAGWAASYSLLGQKPLEILRGE